MADDWPFSDPENLAVMTLRQIVHDGAPILHVVHDADDEGWQFLGGDDAAPDDASVVALRTVVRLDAGVRELADLPPGWRAWRPSPADAWRRERVRFASLMR